MGSLSALMWLMDEAYGGFPSTLGLATRKQRPLSALLTARVGGHPSVSGAELYPVSPISFLSPTLPSLVAMPGIAAAKRGGRARLSLGFCLRFLAAMLTSC